MGIVDRLPARTPPHGDPLPVVVFCNPSFWPHTGGIEHWIRQVAERLTAECRVCVITRRSNPAWAAEEVVDGIRIIRYECSFRQSVPGRLRLFIEASRIIRHFRTLTSGTPRTVFNFFDPRAEHVWAARWLRAIGRDRIVCSLGGTASERAPLVLRSASARSAHALVGISAYAVAAFGERHANVHVCYPVGRQPPDFEGRTATFDSGQILTVCRVHPRKNLEALLEVARRCPALSFVVAGDFTLHREYFEDLLERGRGLGVRNVTFVGDTVGEPLDRLYRQSAVLFMPTSHEMFGLVFSEAMSYGMPVVAPRHSAIPEAVGSGNGILYEPGDLSACVQAITDLTSSRDLWLRYSTRAKAFMKSRFAEDHIGRYCQVLLATAATKI